MYLNAALVSEGCDRHSTPSVPVGRHKPVSIQVRSDRLVVAYESQVPDGIDDVGPGLATSLPTASPGDAQFAVHAALPVNDEIHLTSIEVDVDDDFLDKCTDDPLLQTQVGIGGIPSAMQIGREAPEAILPRRQGLGPNLLVVDASFDLVHPLKSRIPATLELGSDEAIVRVDGVVLLARERFRVARRLQLQEARFDEIVMTKALLGDREHGGIDRAWLYDSQDFSGYGIVDRESTEGDALRLQVVESAAVALVARDGRVLAGICDHQLARAATTAEQSCEQGRSLLRRTRAFFAVKPRAVVVEHALDPEKIRPRNVTFVVVWNQHGPVLERLAHDRLLEGSVDHVFL